MDKKQVPYDVDDFTVTEIGKVRVILDTIGISDIRMMSIGEEYHYEKIHNFYRDRRNHQDLQILYYRFFRDGEEKVFASCDLAVFVSHFEKI